MYWFESSWLQSYVLSVSSVFLLLWLCLTVSLVSSFPFPLVAYVSCHFASSCDAVPGSCIAYIYWYFASSPIKGHLAACFSCHFKSLVLQSQDLLLPALLDDAVFFALILEEFLGIFCMAVWKRGGGREMWFVLSKAECWGQWVHRKNFLVGAEAWFSWVRTIMSFLHSFGWHDLNW